MIDRDPERMAQRFVMAKQQTIKPRTRGAHTDNYATVVGYINLFKLGEGGEVFTTESHLDMATAALFWEQMIKEQQKAILEGRTGEADARKNKARWASYPMRIMVRSGSNEACMSQCPVPDHLLSTCRHWNGSLGFMLAYLQGTRHATPPGSIWGRSPSTIASGKRPKGNALLRTKGLSQGLSR